MEQKKTKFVLTTCLYDKFKEEVQDKSTSYLESVRASRGGQRNGKKMQSSTDVTHGGSLDL